MSTRTTVDKPSSRFLDALPEHPLFEWQPESAEGGLPVERAPRSRSARPTPEPASFTLVELELDLPLEDAPFGLDAATPSGSAVAPDLTDDGLLPFEVDSPVEPDPTLPSWAGMLGVFDLETTGVDTETARIVSAHVGVLDEDGVLVERREWLVDPGVEIPAGASAVHGISTERARRYGRAAAEVVAEILDAVRSVERRGIPLVVYNAPYDLTLLAREAARHGLEPLDGAGLVLDPLVLDRALDRYRSGKRTLTVTAGHYGVELLAAHEAGADAVAAGRLAQALARRFPVELGVSPERLHAMQVEWCREQTARFEEYMRRTKDADFTASGLWPCR